MSTDTHTRIMQRINTTAVGILYEGWFDHLDTTPASLEPCAICTAYTEAIKELSNDADLPI